MEKDKEDEQKVQWLRSEYIEASPDCQPSKRVKVSDIHEQLEKKYSQKYTNQSVADLIRRAFPNTQSKIAGKSPTKHVYGILPVSKEVASTSTQLSVAELTELLETERDKNQKLHGQISLLEACIRELEQITPMKLGHQADRLTNNESSLTACGPDTYEHFEGFSVDGIIHELREQVPDIFSFFMQLADVERHVKLHPDVTSVQERKAIIALCTILNARCGKVKGLQLLISMMLIARSTGRQVCKTMHMYMYM